MIDTFCRNLLSAGIFTYNYKIFLAFSSLLTSRKVLGLMLVEFFDFFFFNFRGTKPANQSKN